MGNIIVLFVIAAAVIFAVRTIYKDKKSGKPCSGCSGCSGCAENKCDK